MIPDSGRPIQPWLTFLRNHIDAIVAIDMLSVPTLGFGRAYALVVVGHRRRAILHVDVTDHPTALWLARQITEAFPWDDASAFLVRDNDGYSGLSFRRRVRAMGIRGRPITPWQNGYVERLISSIRRESLDHLIIGNAAHLRRVLTSYADYYTRDRTHLALDKDAPRFRAVEPAGTIVLEPVLGGLHRCYRRIPPQGGFRKGRPPRASTVDTPRTAALSAATTSRLCCCLERSVQPIRDVLVRFSR